MNFKSARALSDLTLTTSYVDIPDCSVSIGVGVWIIHASAVEDITSSGSNVVPGDQTFIRLDVNAGAITRNIISAGGIANNNTTGGNNIADRVMSSGTQLITLTATTTVKLRARRSATGGVKSLRGGSAGGSDGNFPTNITAVRISD